MDIKDRNEIYKLIPNIEQAICAEVGVAEGLNSQVMLSWGIKKLYLIDLWESHPEFPGDVATEQSWHNKNYENVKKIIAPYAERTQVLRGPSAAMAQHLTDLECDYIYIDCCHDYEFVKADIQAYWPKLKRGGVMAFHDYENHAYGVKRAVTEFASNAGRHVFLIPGREGDILDGGAYVFKP